MQRYEIITNTGLIRSMLFENDAEAIAYIKENYQHYVCKQDSYYTLNSVSLVSPEGYYMCHVAIESGNVEYCKSWSWHGDKS